MRQRLTLLLYGYPEEERNMLNPELGETLKEFSALDGASPPSSGARNDRAPPRGEEPVGTGSCPGFSAENKGCGSRSEKETSMRKRFMRKGVAAVVAALMVLSVGAASAQTQGMERRDERRDDRAGARAEKQACKAGDEKTRAECRQEKRDTKQEGRRDGGQQNTAPATTPAQ
jgi:hypothetical protein